MFSNLVKVYLYIYILLHLQPPIAKRSYLISGIYASPAETSPAVSVCIF